ncbi:hypothetical protein Btru_037684 [Bulinus truncatus]|nr:hypothetical protein Btru_037684 [Bulinus truncatus]
MENSGRITPLCKLMHKQTDDTRNSSKIQSCTSPPRKSITHSDSNVNCATIPDRDVENQIDKVCAENDLNAQCFKSSPCRKVESCEEKIQQENFNDVCFKSTPCGDVEKCADEKSQEKTEDVCFKSPPCRDVEKSDDQTSQDKAKGLCFKSPASRVLEKSIDETSLDKTKGLYFKSPPCRDVEKGGANVLQENTRVLSFKSPPCKNVEKGECKTSQENNKSLRFKSPPCKDIDKGGAKALSFKSPSCKNVEKGAETALQNDSELQCSKSLPCEDNEKSGDEATSETSNSKSDIPPICKNELKQSTVSTPEQMSEIKSKKETSQTTSPWRVSNKPKKLIRMTSPEKPARDNYNVALVENSQVITNLQGIKDAVPGTEKNNITASNLSQNNHDCNNNSNDKNVCGQQNSGATKENASEIKPEDIEIDLSTTDAKESKSFSPCTKSPPCYLKKKEEDAKPEKKVCLKSLPGARCDGEDNTDYARREVIEFSDKACDDKRKENAAL